MVRRVSSGQGSRRPSEATPHLATPPGGAVRLSHLQAEILSVLRSAGGFLLMADLSFELRWRGAVQWQGATADVIGAEVQQLVERGFVRERVNGGASYELTVAGWDACRRAI